MEKYLCAIDNCIEKSVEERYKLLLVDDEPDILEFMGYNLRREGYEVFTASDGESGIRTALREIPHLVLLDVMMPDRDGIETCNEIRTHRQLDDTIVAFLTARAEDFTQMAGFDAGADDYITKPIKPKLLQARISALLRRNRGAAPAENNIPETEEVQEACEPESGITIDADSRNVFVDGKRIILPKKEFELLSLLMSKPEKVFEREEIYGTVWGGKVVVGERTIDVQIRKLREKIGDKRIKTLKGIGYKYVS